MQILSRIFLFFFWSFPTFMRLWWMNQKHSLSASSVWLRHGGRTRLVSDSSWTWGLWRLNWFQRCLVDEIRNLTQLRPWVDRVQSRRWVTLGFSWPNLSGFFWNCLDYKFQEARGHVFYSHYFFGSQHLAQHLAYGRCSINIYWANVEWTKANWIIFSFPRVQ